ncbi:MAG: type IV secretion system protein [Pseudomonadota bacterium]|nr:type IV secretion system protein [Pseudomonadota bacterium]
MLKRNKSSEKIDKKIQRAADFELTVADMARRSEKRAWRVAGASLLMSFALAGGLFYVIPHMEKREPYLVMADARTGTASLVRLNEGADYSRITASQAVNISNVSQYIIARESYDGGRISERDRRVVYTMSSTPVRKGYEVERGRRDPDSLYGRYRDRYAIRVRITTITMGDALPGRPPTGAVVRFQRVLYEVATGISQVLDNKIATIEFKYSPEISFSRPEDGVVNPLRFQVTNYRIDEDRSLPTPEIPAAAAPAPVASAAPEIDAAALQEDTTEPMPGTASPSSPTPNQP